MKLFEVFRQPCRRRYFANWISIPSFLSWAFILASIFLALILAYTTKNLFITENTIYEFPETQIKPSDIFTVIYTNNGLLYYSSSSAATITSSSRIPLTSVQNIDTNNDLLYDNFILNMDFPMKSGEQVIGIKLFVRFQYQLRRLARLDLRDYLVFDYVDGKNLKSLDLSGDVELIQKEPLKYKDYQLISNDNVNETNYQNFDTISSSKIAYLQIGNPFKIREDGRSSSDSFNVKVKINVKSTFYIFKPSFWYSLKWSWIQVCSFLLVFLFVQQRIKEYLFQNNLIGSIIIDQSELNFSIDEKLTVDNVKKFI